MNPFARSLRNGGEVIDMLMERIFVTSGRVQTDDLDWSTRAKAGPATPAGVVPPTGALNAGGS